MNNHPIYTYVPQVLNNVLKDDRRAIEFRFVNTLNMVNNGHREIVLVLAIKFLSAPKHPGIWMMITHVSFSQTEAFRNQESMAT